MATSQLQIYNAALTLCGERELASLSEDREPRYLLDSAWNRGGVRYCLEQGQWNFAMRTSLLQYDPSYAPGFGYRRVFSKPDDWTVTCNVASDEFFRVPLEQYQDEGGRGGFIYCDLDQIYVRFVSDDNTYGMNFASWPESFREFVEAYFASKIVRKITSDEVKIREVLDPKRGALALARKNAKNKDLQTQPTRFRPSGTWTRSRWGNRSGRGGPLGDGGSSGSLTG